MRIVITAISFCEYIIQQANGLAALGHQVLAVMPASLIGKTVGQDAYRFMQNGAKLFACKELRPWKAAYYADPLRAIAEFSPDILHIHDNGEMCTLALALRFHQKPLVLTVHDVTTHPGDDSKLLPRRRLIKALLKHRASLIHLHGDKLNNSLRSVYPSYADKGVVIPHGALTLFIAWEYEKIEKEPLTCLFFGRMEKYRGLDNLLKIGTVLKETVPGIKIIVAGRGSELQKYKAEMTALGIFEVHDTFIPNQDVFRYFRRASLLLLPYHEASQSGVVSMGLPFGIPIVATSVGSIPEVVVDGSHGKIVSPGDICGFAEAVRELLTDRVQLRRMSENCFTLADKLDYYNLAHEFADLYVHAIARKKTACNRGRYVEHT